MILMYEDNQTTVYVEFIEILPSTRRHLIVVVIFIIFCQKPLFFPNIWTPDIVRLGWIRAVGLIIPQKSLMHA